MDGPAAAPVSQQLDSSLPLSSGRGGNSDSGGVARSGGGWNTVRSSGRTFTVDAAQNSSVKPSSNAQGAGGGVSNGSTVLPGGLIALPNAAASRFERLQTRMGVTNNSNSNKPSSSSSSTGRPNAEEATVVLSVFVDLHLHPASTAASREAHRDKDDSVSWDDDSGVHHHLSGANEDPRLTSLRKKTLAKRQHHQLEEDDAEGDDTVVDHQTRLHQQLHEAPRGPYLVRCPVNATLAEATRLVHEAMYHKQQQERQSVAQSRALSSALQQQQQQNTTSAAIPNTAAANNNTTTMNGVAGAVAERLYGVTVTGGVDAVAAEKCDKWNQVMQAKRAEVLAELERQQQQQDKANRTYGKRKLSSSSLGGAALFGGGDRSTFGGRKSIDWAGTATKASSPSHAAAAATGEGPRFVFSDSDDEGDVLQLLQTAGGGAKSRRLSQRPQQQQQSKESGQHHHHHVGFATTMDGGEESADPFRQFSSIGGGSNDEFITPQTTAQSMSSLRGGGREGGGGSRLFGLEVPLPSLLAQSSAEKLGQQSSVVPSVLHTPPLLPATPILVEGLASKADVLGENHVRCQSLGLAEWDVPPPPAKPSSVVAAGASSSSNARGGRGRGGGAAASRLSPTASSPNNGSPSLSYRQLLSFADDDPQKRSLLQQQQSLLASASDAEQWLHALLLRPCDPQGHPLSLSTTQLGGSWWADVQRSHGISTTATTTDASSPRAGARARTPLEGESFGRSVRGGAPSDEDFFSVVMSASSSSSNGNPLGGMAGAGSRPDSSAHSTSSSSALQHSSRSQKFSSRGRGGGAADRVSPKAAAALSSNKPTTLRALITGPSPTLTVCLSRDPAAVRAYLRFANACRAEQEAQRLASLEAKRQAAIAEKNRSEAEKQRATVEHAVDRDASFRLTQAKVTGTASMKAFRKAEAMLQHVQCEEVRVQEKENARKAVLAEMRLAQTIFYKQLVELEREVRLAAAKVVEDQFAAFALLLEQEAERRETLLHRQRVAVGLKGVREIVDRAVSAKFGM